MCPSYSRLKRPTIDLRCCSNRRFALRGFKAFRAVTERGLGTVVICRFWAEMRVLLSRFCKGMMRDPYFDDA
jgi:hypothetical protein